MAKATDPTVGFNDNKTISVVYLAPNQFRSLIWYDQGHKNIKSARFHIQIISLDPSFSVPPFLYIRISLKEAPSYLCLEQMFHDW